MDTYEELLTLIAEMEEILKFRPITYLYNDEISERLYRYRILSTKSTNDQNLLEYEQFNISNLSKRMNYLHNLLESYWNQRTKEYLNDLREHGTTDQNVNSVIKIGDTVFIHNHNAKRNIWKLGKVVRLFTIEDHNARAATVKIHNQNPLCQYIIDPLATYTHLN